MAYTVQQIKVALELYDKVKKVTPTVRQLGYPTNSTLYEWINQRKATGGRFPDLEPNGVKKIAIKVKMDHDGYSAERKLEILKRCFEGTENIRDVANEEGISRAIIYIWRRKYLKYGVFGLQQKKKNIKRTSSLELQRTEQQKDLEEKAPVPAGNSDDIVQLKKQVKELQMKVDVMTEVFELLKKGQGTDLEALKNKEKYFIISALKNKYSILSLLKFLSMSKSSCYYVEKAQQKEDKYQSVRTLLKETFSNNYECYGYRRLYTALKNIGHLVSEKVIRRLMQEEGIKVIKRKKKHYSSYLGELSAAVPNIVNRDFSASAPNEKWLTDIS